MRALVERIFWLDLRSLALMRILLASILIFDLVYRALYLEAHYTDHGVLPRSAVVSEGLYYFFVSFHYISGYKHVQILLFIFAGICALSLLVGYRTRTASLLSWILLLSLHNRNPFLIYGADTTMLTFLFWGIFLPWGRRWSVDSISLPVPSNNLVGGTMPAIIIGQFVLFYVFSHALKTGEAWSNGNAVYLVLMNSEYSSASGMWLARSFPALMPMLTKATLFLELFAPLTFLLPLGRWRVIVVVVLMCFHVFHGIFMTLGLFPWVMVAVLSVLLPGHWSTLLPERLKALISKAAGPLMRYSKGYNSGLSIGIIVFVWVHFAYVTWTNLWNYSDRFTIPEPLQSYGQLTKAYQNWGFFSPGPPNNGGWHSMVATLENGAEVDLLTGSEPTSERIGFAKYLTPHDRHLNHILTLRKVGHEHESLTCQYYVRHWEGIRIAKVELYFFEEEILPNGVLDKAKKHLLGTYLPDSNKYTDDPDYNYFTEEESGE